MAAGTAGKDGGNRDIVFNARRQVFIFELEGGGGLGSHESFCAGVQNLILGPHTNAHINLSVCVSQTQN
jgi:hypothetical protein